ncbi:IucA/IucC family siderophore biosynthesis protein [Paenibacillus alkaliterrae]|uniref:IucA/IucC family protein n=1 Tax=Paenibacillus alkaliterrae TaxID=320909 RepID=UPI001F239EF3|nr:IucA/IucC family siderophore biosynthesis protein [Paenibacillus alkaliterrae]MCF2938674.1 IucA/IucC family siderophore biosynthesis protein [Paenibacillus alkaliterrae]
MKYKQIAEQATIQSFLNCYLRESGQYKLLDAESVAVNPANQQPLAKQWLHCPLPQQGIHLYIPLRYWSITGRHLFLFPIFYSDSDHQKLFELDYITLVTFIVKELSITFGKQAAKQDELMLRVILSCQNIEQYVSERYPDAEQLYGLDMNFIDAEQALIFGHLMHPTPKSRQGISEWDAPAYSPELKGKFPLHYFRAHTSIVCQGSALADTASDIIKQLLNNDPQITDEFKAKYGKDDEYALIPIHPWQAQFLMSKPKVRKLMEQGLLEDLGQQGRAYHPTSSLRTVYHPESDYMIKFSLNIKITNSVRANKYQELERGIEVKKLMESEIGKRLKANHSRFQMICDPAFITLDIDGEKESGFEVILRENPFKFGDERNSTPVASLCQDSIEGNSSRLVEIMKQLAEKEARSTEDVSMDWFKKYLDISLKPIMWLYFTYGIAIEAHQQNSVIRLKEGYPERFFFRDNQGYYYCQSYHEKLNHILPGISQKSNTLCSDAIADERLRYYFFFNHLLGLINAFGTGGLIEERKLLQELRGVLETIEIPDNSSSQLITSLLSHAKLPCKANLLTRFHDMDELTGSLETQSVYVKIDNPLNLKELIGSAG